MAQTVTVTDNNFRIGSGEDLSLMSTSKYQITSEQKAIFLEKGYLIIRDALEPEEAKALQRWAQEVHDLPRTAGVPWMPHEV